MARGQVVAKDASVLLGGQDISGDLNTVTVSRSTETPDKTGFGSATRQRASGGIKDWSIAFAGFFNDNTGAIEERLKALLGGSAVVGVYPHGGASGCTAGYDGVGVASEYSVESPVDGMVAVNATWTGSGDVHRTSIIHPLSACNTAGSLAASSMDFGTSDRTVHGVLRVTSGSGSTPTLDVVIQHSNDDSAWTDLIAFTQVTAGSVVEVKSASTSASQYMRAKSTLGGTNEDFTYMVTVN